MNRKSTRLGGLLLATIATTSVFVAPGCVAAAGAGIGYVLYQETLSNQDRIAHVSFDYVEVWSVVQDVLVEMGGEDLTIQLEPLPRTATAMLGKTKITAEVAAYDLDRTTVLVSARNQGFEQRYEAERVMNRIIERLNPETTYRP